MWFLPKDYVWVDTRIDKAHEKHDKNLSIITEFDIKDKTVIFTAKVYIKDSDQTFTWHSFGEVWKEKAFEKLETVAVWRALAFAGFETRSGIASREEMEVWNNKQERQEEQISNDNPPPCPHCWTIQKWSEKKQKFYCEPCVRKWAAEQEAKNNI